MKVAIMQPYLFPYIGYFQLIKAVDLFVVHDDVQFIKGGWINRNRILVNGSPFLFTFSLKKASSSLNINQRYFSDAFVEEKKRLLRILKASYGKAPYYFEVTKLVEEILEINPEDDISKLITRSLTKVCEYLNISTPIVMSSKIEKKNHLKGEERVIEINKRLKASHYINPIGGLELYNEESFLRHGVRLSFIKSKPIVYPQGKEFVPWLSIIDVLMFNSKENFNELLGSYDLIGNSIGLGENSCENVLY
ncbi:WbqC family protein [Robertmurraya andreesenii]|uniref:WbqC-like protein family protein n=1 Tax=Anoxybacillus andreesenii TaxID=1325932 RepID=A0ABT9V348_9BACL|nr:WbqC family protein [Robertmurraya andreesenii]MDQ0155376.1 hypothetical protein [Robertmurraya andreesenii]